MKYYSIKKLMSKKAHYYIAIGSRGNGKTYQTIDTALDIAHHGYSNNVPIGWIGSKSNPYPESSRNFMIIRRLKESTTSANAMQMFKNFDKKIKMLWGQEATITAWGGRYYIQTEQEQKKQDWKQIGYCVALADAGKIKGNSYEDVVVTINDEFINIDGSYIPSEFDNYLNIISTIARTRESLINFLTGNSITAYTPYFTGFGINTRKLKQGEIYTIRSSKGGIVRLEYTVPLKMEDAKTYISPYVAFDGSVSEMIISGGWQIEQQEDKYNGKTIEELCWSNDYKNGLSIKIDNYDRWITVTENENNPIIITKKSVGHELRIRRWKQIAIYPNLYRTVKYKLLGEMIFGDSFDVDEFKKKVLQ